MAKTTRIGKIHKVENNERRKFSTENLYYFAAILDIDGTKQQFLFTESELERASSRALRNREDSLEQSVFSKLVD